MVILDRANPRFDPAIFRQLGKQMEQSAIKAHWQWQAEGRPDMIMLVHYDEKGRETGRRPVPITYTGWPKAGASEEGCRALWQMLLNVPMQVEGFNVFSDYYSGTRQNSEPTNAQCQFRLSSGENFHYAIYTGDVTQED